MDVWVWMGAGVSVKVWMRVRVRLRTTKMVPTERDEPIVGDGGCGVIGALRRGGATREHPLPLSDARIGPAPLSKLEPTSATEPSAESSEATGWRGLFRNRPIAPDVELTQLEIAILPPRAAAQHKKLLGGAVAVGRVQRRRVTQACGGAVAAVDGVVPGRWRWRLRWR